MKIEHDMQTIHKPKQYSLHDISDHLTESTARLIVRNRKTIAMMLDGVIAGVLISCVISLLA